MSNSRTMTDAMGETASSVWKDFLSLIKIGIVNSNLITTFTGMWLAFYFSGAHFLQSLDIIFLTLAGSSFIIAGSCAVNNVYDRDIDHVMDRTKGRPTVTGKINAGKALSIGLFMILLGTIMLFMTTITAGVIGLVGVISYVLLYTMWSKRRYVSNTIVGSISGAVPPLIGWAAVDGGLSTTAWVLFLLVFIWQPPHFYALAMKRVEEYRAANIPMLPVVKGFNVTKHHIVWWVAALLPLPFFLIDLGLPFFILATAFNIGWLALGLAGYKMKDEIKWSRLMFVYSLNYLTILFVAMVIVTVV
ncbi:heme o synthase [Rossellomorea marisflavi]|uniref:Protoheme IX farnesyltransferase n=1 Tax=Rossellomorea marisflavi TaxID=189381 RepID=A0A0J5Y5P5_9BACI|nr:heme o synthase [Rossellomorea marisflavi]KMK96639.1 protoheme IX farnesyltransferase [Rossellomorea marisflavi]KML32708.1 protoheme IX farnesyltransferase [Rossellomorea marisflavi]KZE49688.1 protoheme IX farnesyltransferase [Rossellomorea marisflavi]MCM2603618.1 heme o synthase [Rossellomorea marisflavi]QHA36027.1 protoheme IX farnesyltransferase [Rossellomorea marisflavi]